MLPCQTRMIFSGRLEVILVTSKLQEQLVLEEPKKGIMFDSEEDALIFYKRKAKKKGFGTWYIKKLL